MSYRGSFTIFPIEAFILTKPKARVRSSDINSFVKFTLGEEVCQTKPSAQKGISPVWDEILSVKRTSANCNLVVELMDYRTLIPAQLIGKISIDVKPLNSSDNKKKYQLWLANNEKVTGKIAFQIIFKPKLVIINQPPSNIVQPSQVHCMPSEINYTPQKEIINHMPSVDASKIKLTEEQQIQQANDRIRKKIQKMLEQRDLTPPQTPTQEQEEPQMPAFKYYFSPEYHPQQDQIDFDCCISMEQIHIIHSQEALRLTTEISIVNKMDYLFLETKAESPIKDQEEIVETHKRYTPEEMSKLLS